jgi:amino acid adenylation domain-containing protein
MKRILTHEFENIVKLCANKTAIETSEYCISYEELNRSSNRLAHRLKEIGVERGGEVTVIMTSGIHLVTSLLGIFKAGGVYLPINITFSPKEIIQIFNQSGSEVVITSEDLLPDVEKIISELEVSIRYLVVLNNTGTNLKVFTYSPTLLKSVDTNFDNDNNPECINHPDDGNYIFYTSGSTGEAKAFLGSHKGLHQFIEWERNEFAIDSSDKVSQLAQITFDASLRDIFLPLTTGATLCIPPDSYRTNMLQLLEWISLRKITLIHCVPSFLRLVMNEALSSDRSNGRATAFNNLKHILVGGEVIYGKDVKNCHEVFGKQVELVNVYGPSETTLFKTFHRIKHYPENLSSAIHVGKPIDECEILVLKDQALCLPEEVGEVYISTPYMTNGYYKNEELNKGRFVQHPLHIDRKEIIYKTGDLGYFSKDGNLNLIGRIDNQVKINGIRVELGEIEQAVLKFPGVEDVVASAFLNSNGDNELVCYYIGRNIIEKDIRDHLKFFLNKSIIPSYLINLPTFPLNKNGKVDRKLLPVPKIQLMSVSEQKSEIEETLEKIWKEILGYQNIGKDASFFSIGGNSLRAIQMIGRIHKTYGVVIKIAEIYENDTISNLEQIIRRSTKSAYQALMPIEMQDYYNLSHSQKTIALLQLSQESYTGSNMPESFLFTGALNREAFEKALQMLVERHDSFRTTIVIIKGELKQKIHSPDAFNFILEYEDLRAFPNPEEEARNRANSEVEYLFDLQKSSLINAKLLQLDEEVYVFLFNTHHIIADGWSMEIVINEILDYYNSYCTSELINLPTLTIQYKDYTAWQNKRLSNDLEKLSNYWVKKFSDHPLPLDFPENGINSLSCNSIVHEFEHEVSNDLYHLSKQSGASLYMTLVSIVNVMLMKYTGESDIVLGSVTAGREHVDLENQVGYYVNILPLRTTIGKEDTFEDLLQNVKTTILEGYENALPFDFINEKLNFNNKAKPLFTVLIQLQHKIFHAQEKSLQNINVNYFVPDKTGLTEYDLYFKFIETKGQVQLILIYKEELFIKETIQNLIDNFAYVSKQFAENIKVSLSDLRIFMSSEEEQENSDFLSTLSALE